MNKDKIISTHLGLTRIRTFTIEEIFDWVKNNSSKRIYELDGLRIKMFKERLKDWNVSKDTLKYLVGRTSEWTGAEVQEFINSLNLKHISSKKQKKKLSQKWAEEIIETMSNFGVGEQSSTFGFGNKD